MNFMFLGKMRGSNGTYEYLLYSSKVNLFNGRMQTRRICNGSCPLIGIESEIRHQYSTRPCAICCVELATNYRSCSTPPVNDG